MSHIEGDIDTIIQNFEYILSLLNGMQINNEKLSFENKTLRAELDTQREVNTKMLALLKDQYSGDCVQESSNNTKKYLNMLSAMNQSNINNAKLQKVSYAL